MVFQNRSEFGEVTENKSIFVPYEFVVTIVTVVIWQRYDYDNDDNDDELLFIQSMLSTHTYWNMDVPV